MGHDRTSAVDLDDRNPYCLLLTILFILKCSKPFFLMIAPTLMTLRRLTGRYLDGDERSTAFSKTGQTPDIFHKGGKNFSFTQVLNSFIRVGDNTGIKFLRTITWALFGAIVFAE